MSTLIRLTEAAQFSQVSIAEFDTLRAEERAEEVDAIRARCERRANLRRDAKACAFMFVATFAAAALAMACHLV